MLRWIVDKFINWLTLERPPQDVPPCDFERIKYELRPGDILLIEGRSNVSDMIRMITQSSWSHAALYIGRIHDINDEKLRQQALNNFTSSPDTHLVVEGIIGKGTIINPIDNYKKDHIRVCRPRGLSRADAQNIIAFALNKVGTDYDVRQILDLARFLLPWSILPSKFRSSLFEYHASATMKTVCSTMIAEAFAHVEFPILPLVKNHADTGVELINRNPKLFTPRDFDYSPYFDIIKFPFIELADAPLYKKLPWNRHGLMSNDKAGIIVRAEENSAIKEDDLPQIAIEPTRKKRFLNLNLRGKKPIAPP